MVVVPDTDIFLLKCELKLDNKNQLTFDSQGDQYNYFTSLPKLELENAKYQRKDGAIRYNGHFDDLIQYNYCMYRNNNYSDKWFFAYITRLEYLNDNCTLVYITTDAFQTWQFDLEYKPSFVEREHIAVDTVGANLVPEGVETGEYKIGGTSSLSDLEPVYILVYSDKTISYKESDASPYTVYKLGYGQFINGIPQACAFIACSNVTKLGYLMTSIVGWPSDQGNNQSEKLISYFTVPKLAVKTLMVDANRIKSLIGDNPLNDVYLLTGTATAQTETFLARPTSIDGYTPRNKKLLTYPYLYLGFNSPFGNNQVFRYEDFTSATPSFKLISEVNPNPTVCLIPQNYRGTSGDNLSDMVTLNGYPQLSTFVDFYNSWLAENSGVINVQTQQQYYDARMNTAGGGLDLVSGLAGIGGAMSSASGGDASSVSSALMGGVNSVLGMGQTAIGMYKNAANYDFYIKQLMATVERQKLLPDQVTMGGSNATILGYDLIDDNIFTRYNIKEQFARRIDGFFDMYGYQTNELKVPEINSRPYWNYVKTQGINIEGDVPENDLAEIRALFDNGVTLWHDATKYLDYSQNNAPVTP